MRKITILVLILTACFASHVASAQETERAFCFKTGNDLVEIMREYEKSDDSKTKSFYYTGVFSGYVAGVYDAQYYPPVDRETITLGQACAVVAKYLKEHPEDWNDTAASLVYQALLEAFQR